MKFVFFVHYFPPLNSTGARRIESFAKYLAREGHEIVIVSTKKSTRDGPLTETVSPYVRLYEIDMLGRVISSTKISTVAEGETGARNRIHWMRQLKQKLMRHCGQLLDNRLGFAFGLRSKFLDDRVQQELSSADLFVSSVPPWPAHLAAYFAQRRFGKPWIADYRDQFSGNHIMNGSKLSDWLELRIDRALLRRAAACSVISEPMQIYYKEIHPWVVCIENGYDEEVFNQVRTSLASGSMPQVAALPTVRYLGTITRDRIPSRLLKAVDRLAAEEAKPSIRVEFYGDARLLEQYVRDHHPGLSANGWLVFLPPVPYEKSIQAMLLADALFFIETSDLSNLSARGVLTTKLFEYLASGRQIIAEIDDATLAATYIRKASHKHIISRDVDTIANALRRLGINRVEEEDCSFVESLSRARKARQFEGLAAVVLSNTMVLR